MDANPRIGLLLETGDPAVAASLPPEGFEARLGVPREVMVFRAASWTGRDAPARIKRLCREQGLNRVVIGGPSSGTGLVPEWIEGQNGQPGVPVSVDWAVAANPLNIGS